MILRIKSEDGSALPMVLFITTALIILAVALSSLVSQWFSTVRSDETEECAYIAGQSVIERCFNKIASDLKSNPGDYLKATPDQTAQAVIGAQKKLMGVDSKTAMNVDVLDKGASSSLAQVKVKFVQDGPAFVDGNYIKFNIGVYTYSYLKDGVFSSLGAKKVFASRQFKIESVKLIKPRFAINALGDVMVRGGTTVNIYGHTADLAKGIQYTDGGDIYCFGTAPKKPASNASYYGGIYVKGNSTLNLNGNAFTQSLVRAGEYRLPDTSKINIYKDVVALGVQAFGSGSGVLGGGCDILINKNVYTFDDVEVNGEDSVIGINGSYFGLSRGDGANHDSSSAMLNSAPIHNAYSINSKKSRIAVNGDVIIQGSAYKTDIKPYPAQLEGGGVAWEGDLNAPDTLPAYKNIIGNKATDYDDYLPNFSDPNPANQKNGYLLDASKNIKGYLNYIQCSDLYGSYNFAEGTPNILKEFSKAIRDFSALKGTVDLNQNKISGFCPTGMAANNHKLYKNNPNDETTSTVEKIQVINDSSKYSVDYLEGTVMNKFKYGTETVKEIDKDGKLADVVKPIEESYNESYDGPYVDSAKTAIKTTKDYWKTYWKKFMDTYSSRSDFWNEYNSDYPTQGLRLKINTLRSTMLQFLKVYAGRTYPVDDEYSGIIPKDVGNSFTASSSIDPKTGKVLNNFQWMAKVINGNADNSKTCVAMIDDDPINLIDNALDSTDINVSSQVKDPTHPTLLCNFNPKRDVVVDSNFYGLIFTVGKVRVNSAGGRNIEGAIIAAGKGYDSTLGISGSACDYQADGITTRLPVIDEDSSGTATNINNLKDGDFAAVEFNGGGTVNFSYIDMKDLLNYFKGQGVDITEPFDMK